VHFRLGEWLPHDRRAHKEWLGGIIDDVDQNPKDLHPVLVEFRDLIEQNNRVYILVSSMFQDVDATRLAISGSSSSSDSDASWTWLGARCSLAIATCSVQAADALIPESKSTPKLSLVGL